MSIRKGFLRMNLLVVDDDKFIRQDILNLVKWKDFGFNTCLEAANGIEALNLLKEKHIEMVITDINMPRLNGIELIKKGLNIRPKTIFFVLSNYDDFEYVKDALKLGAKDYVLKYQLDEENIYEFIKQFKKINNEPEPIFNDINIISNKNLRSEVSKAINYIENNYQKTITLDSVALYCDISRNYLSTIFKEDTKLNFIDYLNQYRINKACALLRNTNQPIKDISISVGFHDYNYFYRIFKKYTKTKPKDFRINK